jgi:hypothetical protein
MQFNSPAIPQSGSFRSTARSTYRGEWRRFVPASRAGLASLTVAAAVFCVGLFGVSAARAATPATPGTGEIVTLADNTQVSGKVTHYYDGIIVMETSGGQKIELPRDKVKAITFKLPPARPEFVSPEKTFERWRQAMQKGDVSRAVDCYALMYQGQVGQQMMQSADALKQAQKDLEGVVFELRGATYQSQGEMKLATLKVRRTKGENVQTDEIHLVLENGEWKMTP